MDHFSSTMKEEENETQNDIIIISLMKYERDSEQFFFFKSNKNRLLILTDKVPLYTLLQKQFHLANQIFIFDTFIYKRKYLFMSPMGQLTM